MTMLLLGLILVAVLPLEIVVMSDPLLTFVMFGFMMSQFRP